MLPGIAPVMDTASHGKWPGDETEGRPRVCDSQGHGEGHKMAMEGFYSAD